MIIIGHMHDTWQSLFMDWHNDKGEHYLEKTPFSRIGRIEENSHDF
jgi:hypothetical protein